MKTITRPGDIEIPYVVDGDGDARTLIFAHGLMGVGVNDRIGLRPLVDAGWTIVTFDQRGHAGATPVVDPSGYDPEAMGEDLWAVADAAGADRCWIGGGSMGAATSFRAARSHPERVQGLVQVVPAIRDEAHAMVPVFEMFADRVRDAGIDGFITTLDELLVQMGAGPERAVFLEQLRAHDAASLECALRTVPKWIFDDVPSAFADLPFPVVVVGWDDDPIHPLQTAKDIASAAGVELIELDQRETAADRPLLGRLLVDALQTVRT